MAGVAMALVVAAHGRAAAQVGGQGGGQPGGEIPAAMAAQPVVPIRHELVRDVRYRPDVKQGVEQRRPHPPFDQLETLMPPMGGMQRDVALDESLMVFNPATGQTERMTFEGITSPPGEPVTRASRGAAAMMEAGYGDRALGTMSLVPQGSRRLFPNSTACRVVVEFIDLSGNSRFFTCSGTMIDSGAVLTAGHCVYSHDPSIMSWAVQAWVYPGWDGTADIGNESHANPISEFGYSTGGLFLSTAEYFNTGDPNRDLGVILLARGFSRSVGMLAGWVATSHGVCAPASGWSNTSYPSEACGGGLHTGLEMYTWSGTVDACPNVVNNRYLINTTPGCLTAVWGGMDGSALLDAGTRTAYGVISESNRSTQAGAAALTPGFLTGIQTYVAAQRGSSLDLEPLRCRMINPEARAGEMTSSFSTYVVNATNADPVSRFYTMRAYLSDDSDIDAGDTLLGTYEFEVDFEPMSGVLFLMPEVRIPSNTPAGPKWIGCIFDPGTDGESLNDDTDGFDAAPITILPCVPPATTTGLDASVFACAGVYASWPSVSNADVYRLHRSTVNDFATASVVYEGAAANGFDAAPPANVDLYYWVTAANACGESAPRGPQFIRVEPDAPPSNLAASDALSCEAIELRWTNSPDTYSVAIYRSTDLAGSDLVFIASSSSDAYNDFSAVPGLQYHYWMYGYGECGWSSIIYGDVGSVAVLPPGVAAVTASDGGSCLGVLVSWMPAEGAFEYGVFRSVGYIPTSPEFVGWTTQLHFTDYTATYGTVYTYTIVSYNVCGSAGFIGAFDSGFAGDGTGVLGPVGVSATESRCDGVSVSWLNNGSFSYSVYREVAGMPTTRMLVGSSTASPFLDESADPGVNYMYSVTGINACGDSSPSAADLGTRSSATTPMPTGLVANPGASCQTVDLSWNPVAGADEYLVLRSEVADFSSGTLMGITSVSMFTDPVAGMGRVYYRVVARGSCGYSDAGDIVTALPFGGIDILSIPTQVIVNEGEEVVIRITDSGAFDYRWYGPSGVLTDGGRFFGTRGAVLFITAAEPGDAGFYHCDLSKPCGILTSPLVELIVNTVTPCPADFNQDGGVDGSDVDAFFLAWEAGEMAADVNQDGGVDGSDIDTFFIAWENGGC
jgi:hypothetical protein